MGLDQPGIDRLGRGAGGQAEDGLASKLDAESISAIR